MKKKQLVIFFLAVIPIYLIYNFTYKENYTYLAIGDDLAKGHTPFDTYGESYTDYLYEYLKNKNEDAKINKEFIEEDIRIRDLINKIKNAETKSEKTFTQAIKEADLITISIGSEELFSKIRSNYELIETNNNKKMFDYIDNLSKDLDELIKEMKKIKKVDIYLIGYYNPITNNLSSAKLESIFNYLDVKLKALESKYKIHYVSIYEEFKKKPYYLPNPNHAFPSLEGYNYISNEIIKELKEN